MKKNLSLWIEFLIYTSFSLLALSYVLYYVHLISEREKSKIDIEELINILNEFHGTLNIYKNCGICSFIFKKKLPERAELFLFNNSNFILATYFSKTEYLPNYDGINITKYKGNNWIYYNISKNTYSYYIKNLSSLKFSKEFCIKIKIFFDKILIEKC